MQTDERWAGLPYAETTIGESGCGLTCAAMAWSYLSNEVWTPVRLLNSVGNSNVQEGQNYMPGFCEWMVGQDPTLDCSVLYESRDRALEESADGRMVFASMTGQLHGSGQSYGGHIVLITGTGNGLVTINDPCEESEVQISVDDFQSVSWGYFISIGRNK